MMSVGTPRFRAPSENFRIGGLVCDSMLMPSTGSSPTMAAYWCMLLTTPSARPNTTLPPRLCPTSATFSKFGRCLAKASGITATNPVGIQFRISTASSISAVASERAMLYI